MKNKVKISYEPEADVLTWEIADKPIDFAKEIGDVVVHFTKNNIPVLIEILEASKFLAKTKNLMKDSEISIRKPSLSAR